MEKDMINDVKELEKDLIETVDPVEEMLSEIIDKHSQKLDVLMADIQRDVINEDNPPLKVIEDYFMQLSTELYFSTTGVEKLGLFHSISKTKSQENYNMNYLRNQTQLNDGKKPTVAEITAKSENENIYNSTLHSIYERAYRILQAKISSAETVVKTLNKIITNRMQETRLTSEQTGRQILNEGSLGREESPF